MLFILTYPDVNENKCVLCCKYFTLLKSQVRLYKSSIFKMALVGHLDFDITLTLNLTSEMDSAYLKIHKKTSYTSF